EGWCDWGLRACIGCYPLGFLRGPRICWSELNGSAAQFQPKARRRLHMCRPTSRSYSCVPISAARVPLLPQRLRSHRNGSYRPHREAANATAQKSAQLRQIDRSSDRPIATLGPQRLRSAGSSLPAVPTVPSLVYIRSLSGLAGGHPFVFQVPEPTSRGALSSRVSPDE